MSTHLPDCDPGIVLLAFRFHFWLDPPPQVQISSLVPFAVEPPVASRHLVTPPMVTRSSFAEVEVQLWLAPPLQVQISTCVPLALLFPVTSRHLPDAEFTSVLAVIAACAPGTRTTVAAITAAAAPPTASAWRSLILMGLSKGRWGTGTP